MRQDVHGNGRRRRWIKSLLDAVLAVGEDSMGDAKMSECERAMRLFVWERFCPDYTDGLAFAIAENVEQAQKLVIESKGYEPYDWGDLKEFSVTEPRAYCVSGGG